jgi:HD-GYP domain-containing protein (c-di-GMP phosphodiesterase class II)
MKTSNKNNDKISVETKRLKNQIVRLKREHEQLNALLNITKNLSAEINLNSLLFTIMDEVRKILKADRCTVFILDEEKNELWSKVALGLNEEIRFPANKGIAGHVCKTGEIVNIPDAYKDSRFNPEIDKKTGYRTKSILAMPLRNRLNRVIGVFQVLNKKGGPFTKKNVELLSAIASIASAPIENAQLYEEQKHSFISFIETLSTTLDTRDYITAGHSRRVTLYGVEIARLMKLGPEQQDIIRLAGLLHDIGKIGVPEVVLFKDRKLTEDEYEIIKRHANLTKSILSKIHFLKKYSDIPQIAGSHHERIDGKGYPENLKGDDIPLGGKILAVADAFDALTSRKPYQDRLELDEVMEVIEKDTGTAFEPFVVYNFKFISLKKLILILEYGHTQEMDVAELKKLDSFTLSDIIEIRTKAGKTTEELEIENIFMRYYLRQYRSV